MVASPYEGHATSAKGSDPHKNARAGYCAGSSTSNVLVDLRALLFVTLVQIVELRFLTWILLPGLEFEPTNEELKHYHIREQDVGRE